MSAYSLSQKVNRSSSIELLRIVLMSMIVLWHFVVHGVGMAHDDIYAEGLYNWTHMFIAPFLCFHVNCFIFISGFFGITLRKEKLLSLLLMLFFYGVVTMFADPIINKGSAFIETFHWDSWQWMFPFSDGGWWFMTNYLALMILSPLINKGVDALSKRHFTIVLSLLFLFIVSGFKYIGSGVFDKGYLFLFMYLLGRYLNKYPVKSVEFNCGKILVFSITCLILYMLYYSHVEKIDATNYLYAVSYHNPFCISAAVCFFFIFWHWKIGYNRMINMIASGSLATYLITDGWLQMTFTKKIYYTFGDNIFVLAVVAIIVVVTCSLFEVLRKTICAPFEERLVKYIDNHK